MAAKNPFVQPCAPGMSSVVGGLVLATLMSGVGADPLPGGLPAMDTVRRKELVTLVRQDCGSCHGLTLQGGLGPALLPDTLKNQPAEYLQLVIMQGRPGTAMPPWKRFLTATEAAWIVSNLQKGFPSER